MSNPKIQSLPNLSIRKIDSEIFILNRSTAEIHTFNETGTFIWELIEKKHTIEDISRRISEEYEITPEAAFREIDEFIADLKNKQLIL